MTYNRKAFIEYSTDNLQAVETASGAVLAGAGQGKVRLHVVVGGRTESIVLTDVLHVSQIRENLISVARLQDKGLVAETTALPAKNALVIKDQGETIGIADRIKNSYVLNMLTDRAFPVRQIADQDDQEVDNTGVEYAL
jgi:hypothetical protein